MQKGDFRIKENTDMWKVHTKGRLYKTYWFNTPTGRRFLFLAFTSLAYFFTASLYDERVHQFETVKMTFSGRNILNLGVSGDNGTFCTLPNLNPFDKSIMEFVKTEAEINCDQDSDDEYKRLFKIDNQGKLVWIGGTDRGFEAQACCFMPFNPTGDLGYSSECVEINSPVRDLPDGTEFISIYCRESNFRFWEEGAHASYSLADLLAFTPLKGDTEDRAEEIRSTRENETGEAQPQVSIIIFGMDSVSHLNFQRTMPKTRSYLLETMSGAFLNGYTKVADNTFPNMVPVLAGLTEGELQNSCWPDVSESYLDGCDFIWKAFAATGYRTAYSEDAIHISIFNYQKRGFEHHPTDYFLNDFMERADREIGHWSDANSKMCYGPRLAFTILLENMEKLKIQMGQQRPYFHFTWTTSLTHDTLNNPGIVDVQVAETLKSLYEAGQLNNTIFIFMSDHGARSGKIRETFHGRVEESMPFLYAVFPPWFKKSYPRAVQNFIHNQHLLTTPFDTHEMLKDLVNLTTIEDEQIQNRQESLINGSLPRGISLFLNIPKYRNCDEASIPESYCICHGMNPISIESPDVRNSAYIAVDWLNTAVIAYPQCMTMELSSIVSAYNVELRQTNDLKGMKPVEYAILFETKPGDALFEATLTSTKDEEDEGPTGWEVTSEISRVNRYGNQSHCVDDYTVKKYCYCR